MMMVIFRDNYGFDDKDLVLDVPQEHREQYMVTSGHKVAPFTSFIFAYLQICIFAYLQICILAYLQHRVSSFFSNLTQQANHKFEENNGVLVTAFHPLLGKVGDSLTFTIVITINIFLHLRQWYKNVVIWYSEPSGRMCLSRVHIKSRDLHFDFRTSQFRNCCQFCEVNDKSPKF